VTTPTLQAITANSTPQYGFKTDFSYKLAPAGLSVLNNQNFDYQAAQVAIP